MSENDPEPVVNDLDEEPSEFEKHGGDLAAAMTDAFKRGDIEVTKRLAEELDEHNQKRAELNREKFGEL